MARKAKYPKGSYGAILEFCLSTGKEKALEYLNLEHEAHRQWEANLWAEPELHDKAREISDVVIKRAECLARLRHMSEDDMRRALHTGAI